MNENEKRLVEVLENINTTIRWIALWLFCITLNTCVIALSDTAKVDQAVGSGGWYDTTFTPDTNSYWAVYADSGGSPGHKILRVRRVQRNNQLDSILAHVRFEGGRIIIDCPVSVRMKGKAADGNACLELIAPAYHLWKEIDLDSMPDSDLYWNEPFYVPVDSSTDEIAPRSPAQSGSGYGLIAHSTVIKEPFDTMLHMIDSARANGHKFFDTLGVDRPSLNERFQRAWDSLSSQEFRATSRNDDGSTTYIMAPRYWWRAHYPKIQYEWWDSLAVLKADPHVR